MNNAAQSPAGDCAEKETIARLWPKQSRIFPEYSPKCTIGYIFIMKYFRFLIIFLAFTINKVHSQKYWTDISIDTLPFNKDSCKLEKKIFQDGVNMKVYYGDRENSKFYKTLCIIKIDKEKKTILLKMLYNQDLYDFVDINNDGYTDFCTTYHDFYIAHFYDKQTKSFHTHADGWFPIDRKLIDKKRNIYCDSYGPMYGYANNESTIYSMKGLKVNWLYKIVFITKVPYEVGSIMRTKLYKYQKRKNGYKTIFIKNLNTKDVEHYYMWWEKNYKSLLNISRE